MSNKVPQIRFNGYSDAWVQRKFSDLYKKNLERNKEQFGSDRTISIATMRFKEEGNGASEDSLASYKVLREGDVAFEGHTSKQFAFGRFVLNDIGDGIMSPRFTTLRPTQDMPIAFWKQYIHYEPIMRYPIVHSTKLGTMMNELVVDEFLNQSVLVPSVAEQLKIGQFLTLFDNLIAANQRKLDLLKEQKKGYLQKMFPKNGAKVPELRFAGFADDWEERKFKDILKTHSFRSYLADGSDDGKYEVIQQGNNPIVGYSDGEPFTDYKDITLFGDHTVSLYNPQSPFFIATDGVKILSADNFEGDYLYTTLERYKPAPQGYKRHFTILKNKDLCFTRNVEEQKQIGSFFKQLDNTITLHQRKLDLLKEQKKGFLQKMFV